MFDPATWGFIILSSIGGVGLILFICTKPCNRLDDEILYGEGCCNRYFRCCVTKPNQFSDNFNKVNGVEKIKQIIV